LENINEEPKRAVVQLIAKAFGIIMVVLYIIFGTTIIFKAEEMQGIPAPVALTFGVFLILYGIFRAYKLYRRYFSSPVE
jgi:hypothetical protein